MEQPREKFKTDDSVDDDDEEHEEGDVQERNHRHQDCVQHDLETFGKGLIWGREKVLGLCARVCLWHRQARGVQKRHTDRERVKMTENR